MVTVVLMMSLILAAPQEEKEVSAAEKQAFLELLPTLPRKGEFFAEEAIDKVAPHIRVLLALTPADIDKYDLYPFLALSRGLIDRKEQRAVGVKHFEKIAHPTMKLAWGAMLFNEKAVSAEIVTFLRAALTRKEDAAVLEMMVGPGFADFKKRVRDYPLKEK
jgi:hypothetical protein